MMTSTRTSRSVYRRPSKFNEESSEKERSSGIRGKQQKKRKLSDMLGAQWSKDELESFYAAYRKYGKNWMKVASFVQNRSVEMVEALYSMNRAYLSLPEGTASVVGLIAMMTDHYNILEGSGSERESSEGPPICRKPLKRARRKFRSAESELLDTPVTDPLQSHLSFMKTKHSDGIQPRVVGKRTPRYPVSIVYGEQKNEKFLFPNKQRPLLEVDNNDDEVAHGAVMVLAGALQRGNSSQVIQTSNRRMELIRPSPSQNKDSTSEGSLSSKEAENGDFSEGINTMDAYQKGKKPSSRKPRLLNLEDALLDDGKEACSGTEEGLSFSIAKEKNETEVTGRRTGSSRRRSRQLYEDEKSALDALNTLADISMKMVPTSPDDTDRDLSDQSKEDAELTINMRKGKRRPPELIVPAEEGKTTIFKPKRVGQRRKSARPLQLSSCGDLVRLEMDPERRTYIPTKVRSKRKLGLRRILAEDVKSSDNSLEIHLKKKVSRCLSSKLLRRWCRYEFFYSAIDYPWFAKNEFVDYLEHVELGYVQKLTRFEWGVIRSSLGKPRRLSDNFLQEEKEKLEQYRESVRKQYTELREGTREGHPADLALPLHVGQRVVACHPKTQELHNGAILNVDENRCRVQFDRPELGVAFVLDMNCMPLNPLENLPVGLRRQSVRTLQDILNEHRPDGESIDYGGYLKVASTEHVDIEENKFLASSATNPIDTLFKHVKVSTANAISQSKAAATKIANALKASCTQPCTLAQRQAKEADIRALVNLTRVLDKKESVVLELTYMNNLKDDKVQKESVNNVFVKGSPSFKQRYTQLLQQLKDANVQVSDALLSLRELNTYQSVTPPWLKPIFNSDSPEQPSFVPEESGSRIVEILESTKTQAREIVDAAFQAMGNVREGEDAFVKIGKALDSSMDWRDRAEPSLLSVQTSSVPYARINNLAYQNHSDPCTSEPEMTVNGTDPKLNSASEKNDMHNPSELISSCVATLLKIQACTERQYPPAEVAQILDSAVTSLQPCSSQNMQIFREIQICMGVIKTQILALVPT